MNKASFLVLGAVISMGSFLMAGAGCGGGSGGGGGGGGTGGSASTSTSTSTSTSSQSSTGSSMAQAATCDNYCTNIMANCPDMMANQQYPNAEACKAACATFPQGKIGDASGDSLECRAYHAGAAKSDPKTHCPHAGPTGGSKDGKDATCGNGCEAFCNLAVKTCSAQYKDLSTCMGECATFKSGDDYNITDTDKDDFGCRMYHLSVASESAANATMHCPHIIAKSPVCTM